MPIPCSATCKDGGQCSFKAKRGHAVCGKHMAQDRVVVVILCGHQMTNGRTCTNVRGEGLELCARHHAVIERRAELRRAREVMFAAVDALWTDNDPVLARLRLLEGVEDGRIDRDRYEDLGMTLEEEIAFWTQLHVLPAQTVVRSDLHRLSLDAQNVHTKEVSIQTNDALALLLSTAVPSNQDTFREIAIEWERYSKKERLKVLKDMHKWYNTPGCREDGDRLYQRVLNGLWTTIRSSSFKTDLCQRLWEECSESVGVCCDGHITRLCNVLVGFDDAFVPEIPVGVLLQQKMAAIATKDVRVEHKVGEAWGVFEELKIPMDQRMAWLEAF